MSTIITSISSSSIPAYPAEHHRGYSIMHRWRHGETLDQVSLCELTHTETLDLHVWTHTDTSSHPGSGCKAAVPTYIIKKKQYFEKTPLNLETIETINLDCVSKRGTFTASSTQIQGCVSIKERRKTLQEIDAIIAKSLDLLRLLCYTDSLCVLCCE